jgi:rod shape-determining protein MreB
MPNRRPSGALAVRMLNWMRQRFCSDLAIDLGTTSTQIGLPGEGIRLDEPSVVAVPAGSRQVAGKGAAVGKLAHQMLGRTPESISAVRPLRHGVISDFELTEAMLRYFIRKAARQKMGMKPRVVIAVPGGITAVEKRAVFNSAERAGAGQIWLIEESRAAGIGAGLPVSEPLASMICDIGGGTTEVAVMSLGDVVASRSIRVAGDAMDAAIVQYLRRQYSLRTGEFSAEQLKVHIGSAAPLDHELSREISGLDTASGVPRKAVVTSEEVRESLYEPLERIVDAVRGTIENCQPELVADLADTGMVLAGGGALLRGIDRYLNQQLGIPVRIAESPRTTVTRGAMICLDHLDQWRDWLDNGT